MTLRDAAGWLYKTVRFVILLPFVLILVPIYLPMWIHTHRVAKWRHKQHEAEKGESND